MPARPSLAGYTCAAGLLWQGREQSNGERGHEADSGKAASRLRVRAGPTRESPLQAYLKDAVCRNSPARAPPMQCRCPITGAATVPPSDGMEIGLEERAISIDAVPKALPNFDIDRQFLTLSSKINHPNNLISTLCRINQWQQCAFSTPAPTNNEGSATPRSFAFEPPFRPLRYQTGAINSKNFLIPVQFAPILRIYVTEAKY